MTLLVYGILKNHSDGLFRAEIERELTYNGKTRLSNKTTIKRTKQP